MAGRFDLEVATIGQLLADPEAKAIIDDVVPGMSDNPMVAMVKAMPAKTVLAMAAGQVDAATLDTLTRRLSALA